MDKRSFLKSAGLIGLGGVMSWENLTDLVRSVARVPSDDLAKNEEFWAEIRKGYRLKPDFINLENGYYNFLPEQILEKYIQHARDINYEGSYYMRTVQVDNKKAMAEKLADLLGCPADEVAITRNATESLDLVIGGFDWKAGDEAVMAEQDYPTMLDMFRQVAKRYGVVNKTVSVPNHPASDEEIVNLYASAITSRTRLLMICQMINITGHILPVKKICDMAHSRGVKVLVDGAHAVAHFRFTIPELGCDYYGSSLHKWLSVPLGSGLLWVRKDLIPTLWPLLASAENHKPDDIARLNHTGTLPVHTDLAVADAINFYNTIGAERKESRLRYLKDYWVTRVKELPHVVINTPFEPHRSCGIGNVGIKGMKPEDLGKILFERYRIYTAPIDGAGVHGCRITPNIYTTSAELDVLVKALSELKPA
jgi:selenocysteine lyase/cysteine desulfurase